MAEPTLNQKIEAAWSRLRVGQVGLTGKDRKQFKNAVIHALADAFDIDMDRVRQRIDKFERRVRYEYEQEQAHGQG